MRRKPRQPSSNTSNASPLPIPRKEVVSRPRCPLCNKEVSLETANSDENGHAVHKHCYVLRIRSRQSQ